MSVAGFQKATKSKSYARIALSGPPGSGKTYTSLEIAQYLAPNGNYLVIDTERGSASKYAGDFPFEYYVEEPTSFSPRSLIPILDRAREAGIDVVIIDSLSHYWMGTDGMLDQVSKIAKRKNLASEFPAWKDASPDEKAMWDAILGAPLHVIVTTRTKTEYVMEEVAGRDGRTRNVPKKVGLAPVQRAGLEYEFDIVADLDVDQNFVVTKTRCKALNEYVTRHAGREFALKYKAWLDGGVDEPVRHAPAPEPEAKPKADPERTRLFNRLATALGSKDSALAAVKAQGIDSDTPIEEIRWFVEFHENPGGATTEPAPEPAPEHNGKRKAPWLGQPAPAATTGVAEDDDAVEL